MRSVVTNVQPDGFDIIDSEMCTLYLQQPETIIRLFLDCKIVKKFWKDVEDWISAILRFHIPFSNLNKLFGFQEKVFVFSFQTSLLFSARFLIYRCKYSNRKPKMQQCFNFLTLQNNLNILSQKQKKWQCK